MELDLRVLRVKGCEPGGKPMRGELRRHRDPNPSSGHAAALAGARRQRQRRVLHRLRLHQRVASVRGERVTGIGPVEQRYSERRFERRQTPGDSRMFDVEPPGGGRNPPGPGDGEKRLQRIPVHAVHSCTSSVRISQEQVPRHPRMVQGSANSVSMEEQP
jgi:hypothetical protein